MLLANISGNLEIKNLWILTRIFSLSYSKIKQYDFYYLNYIAIYLYTFNELFKFFIHFDIVRLM